ncbi:MAG: WecB/TagA/CpsF family glycosyltransferase [Treponema sp.]|jgi:N-acetylglucosaminyldiphosphoundecaprenol N-acetyl-beta-D-mannosaminyltransferase|nr:WecB/TagA/CpsF family glycosyltransferase [Treponema sp.]
MGTETFVTQTKERIYLLDVPIDIVKKENLPVVIGNLLGSEGASHIVLLSLWDFLRAKRNSEYRSYVLKADVIIPISKSLVSGVRFLTGKESIRYLPFDFIIAVLSTLEEREHSVYLMGGKKKVLEKAEKNVRKTFPRLQVVGRYAGRLKKNRDRAILEAIRKASPSLVLVGKGIPGKELWIWRKSGKLGAGIRLWCSDIYAVFANKRRHPTDYAFKYGLEWVEFCFRKPFYFLRVFLYIYYKILLLFYKFFKNRKSPPQSGEVLNVSP